MKVFSKTVLAGCIAALGLALAPAAKAIDTNIQFSTAGNGTYDVTGINEFDWQSSGDLVVVDLLPGAGSIANGTLYTSFFQWATNAVVGNTVLFNIHAHARLNDMLASGGGSIAPGTLDANGTLGGDTGFEVTAALSATEGATLIAPGVLLFTTISGTYKYFYDDTPDSDVASGAGFLDGVEILAGNVISTGGTFIFGTGGSSLLRTTVTSYDDDYIETDPLSNKPLVGTTFDTLVTLVSSGEASVTPGSVIGLPPYTMLSLDQVFKADANSEFAGTAPEPATAFLLGGALLGLAFGGRRRRS